MTPPRGSWPIAPAPFGDPLDDDPVDVLVVGAGINGLLAALGALQHGLTVRVVEAHLRLGRLASGLNTGKATALQGTQLSQVARSVGRDAAVVYAHAQVAGVAALRRHCDDLGVPYDVRAAGTFVFDESDVSTLEKEQQLATAAGLPVSLTGPPPQAPYAAAALMLPGQIQLNPQTLLEALAGRVRELGGLLHLGARVRRVAPASDGSVLTTVDGDRLRARHVVVTTGTPILARGGYFARLSAQRSYIVAFRGPRIETPMLISADSPSRSIRDVSTEPFALMVGGAGHGVGRTRSELDGVEEICAWAARTFPEHTPVAHWSAQDYMSIDRRPVVEGFRSGTGSVIAVTGMNKWGLTNAVEASDRVVASLTGQTELPGAARGTLAQISARGVARLLGHNAAVGVSEVVGSGRALKDLAAPAGRRERHAGICTHLGGTLTYNDAEGSLDCPLHGSRFETDGSVIEGYATRRAPTVGS